MSTDTTVSPLHQRMIEDMTARKLGPHSHPPFPDARAPQGLPPHRHYGLFANGNRAANHSRANRLSL
jgi:hypothetical protein